MPKATQNSNQTKLQEAILRLFEKRFSCRPSNVRRPDEDGIGASIDLLFSINGNMIAVEHTILQSYQNQIWESQNVDGFVQLIKRGDLELPSRFYFDLVFRTPVDFPKAFKDREFLAISIRNWVQQAASRLAACDDTHFESDMRIESKEFGKVSVSLLCNYFYRPKSPNEGGLRTRLFAPDHLEKLRLSAIRNSVESNFYKLNCYRKLNYQTVLVLEEQDISISNYQSIARALEGVEKCLLPDEVFYADTTTTVWYVLSLFRDGAFLPDAGAVEPYHCYERESLVSRIEGSD